MFNSGGFKPSKLKPLLKMAVSRFQISANKRTALMKQQMREIAKLLAEDPPKEEKARIRAEALIREDNTIEAYEILQLTCEILCERIKLIASQRTCPSDLRSSISTLIWAANRVEIPELVDIKKQFRAKYGQEFEDYAMAHTGLINERVVARLSVQPPTAYLVQTYLEKISDEFEINWKPTQRLGITELGQPMAAPVGYSVQLASGSGLTPVMVTGGTVAGDDDRPDPNTMFPNVGRGKPGDGFNNNNGAGSGDDAGYNHNHGGGSTGYNNNHGGGSTGYNSNTSRGAGYNINTCAGHSFGGGAGINTGSVNESRGGGTGINTGSVNESHGGGVGQLGRGYMPEKDPMPSYATPIVQALPSSSGPPAMAYAQRESDFEEPDIFIPKIPGQTGGGGGTQSHDDKSGTSGSHAGKGNAFADLEARFNQLKR